MNQYEVHHKNHHFGFGIRADGRLIKAGYLSAEIAEWYTKGLFGKGYASVEVIDLATGRCVKQMIPEARHAP